MFFFLLQTRNPSRAGGCQFGEAAKVVSQGRTSENAWCRENCDDEPLVRSIIERIEAVLGVGPYPHTLEPLEPPTNPLGGGGAVASKSFFK